MMASYPFWYHDYQGHRGEELNALTHLSLRGRSRKYEWNPLVVTTNGFYSLILTTESGVEKVQWNPLVVTTNGFYSYFLDT